MIPKRAIPNKQFGEAWNRATDELRSHVPIQGPGILTSHTPHGVIRETDMPSGVYGVSEASTGMTFRGEWSTSGDYSTQDVVVIRTGTNAGTYVCVADNPGESNPPTTPDTGNAYWVRLLGGSSIGSWV